MPYGDQSGDPVMLALGEDYPELRQSVRKICEKYPGAYWRKLEDEQAYPTEFVTELTEGGFLASLIPEEYGGSGLPLRAAAVILEEINGSGCTASQGHAQMYIMGTLLRHGSAAQKERYLPGIASGELRLQAFGVTEPTTGSDTTKLKTRAVRAGNDYYLVSGQKVWTSRARHSDLMLLLARTTPIEEVKRRTDGLSVFLVDLRDSLGHGLEIRPIEAMINHNTNEVFFDKPIGQNQGVQFPLARAYAELEAADMICRRAAALFDAGRECGADANMAKLLASEATWHAADATFQTFGGFAFAKEYDIERKWREVRIYQTAPISTNLILAYIGQHVLGMPRSY